MPNDFTPPNMADNQGSGNQGSADNQGEANNQGSDNQGDSNNEGDPEPNKPDNADKQSEPNKDEPNKDQPSKDEPNKEEPKKEEGKPEQVDTSKWNLTPPEGSFIKDEQAHKAFLETCSEHGINEAQAQALVNYHATQSKKNLEAQVATGTKSLKDTWGMEYDKNVELATRTVALVDKKMDGDLVKILNSTSLAQHPETIRLFHFIGNALSEDSLGAKHMADSFGKPKTTVEFMKDVFNGK